MTVGKRNVGRRGGSCNHDPLLIRQSLLLLSYPPVEMKKLKPRKWVKDTGFLPE